MLSEKRLNEIRQLAYADHKSFGSTGQALAAVRLGLRDLLPEIERLRKVEQAARQISDALENRSYDPHSCGYCGARGVEFELGDPVVRGGPRCIDAGECQGRIDEEIKTTAQI